MKNSSPDSKQLLSFTSENHRLSGTLHLPPGDGPFPTLVVIHGASAGNQDDPIYLHLARVMNPIGVAVFIYDRRDQYLPLQSRIHPGYPALGRDAIAAVHRLQAHPAVDAARIGLWGLSQGGWVAPAAFAQSPGDFAFMILVSSCGVGPEQQMEYAVAHVFQSAGYDPGIVDAAIRIRRAVHRFYRGQEARRTVQALLDRYKDESWFPHLYLNKALPADPIQTGWYNEIQFRPRATFSQVTAPLLLIYGADDPWIPVDHSIAVWRDCLAQTGNDRYEIHRLPGVGHRMIPGEAAIRAGDAAAEQYSPLYENHMHAFLRRYL